MTYEQILEWIEENLSEEIQELIDEGYSSEEIVSELMEKYDLPDIFSVFLEDLISEAEEEEKGIGEKLIEGIKSIGQKIYSFFKGLFK